MIIIFGPGIIFLIIIIAMMIFDASIKTIISILTIGYILFLIAYVIQDIVYGMIKMKNGVICGILFFITDVLRVSILFSLIKYSAYSYENSHGFAMFLDMIAFIIILLFGIAIFLMGEVFSKIYISDMDYEDYPKLKKYSSLVADIMSTGLLFLFAWYFMS